METKIETRKIGRWDATVIKGNVSNEYTITFNGVGGAIVSDRDLLKAEEKFINAMAAQEANRRLISYGV